MKYEDDGAGHRVYGHRNGLRWAGRLITWLFWGQVAAALGWVAASLNSCRLLLWLRDVLLLQMIE